MLNLVGDTAYAASELKKSWHLLQPFSQATIRCRISMLQQLDFVHNERRLQCPVGRRPRVKTHIYPFVRQEWGTTYNTHKS